jgi:ABC-2 type transport system permease protein
MMIVMSVVFSFMFRFEIDNFPLYLILGMILFNLMTNSTSGGLMSIIDSAALIKKVRINKAVFPMEKVVFELVNFAISLIAVLLVFIFFLIFPSAVPIVPTLNILFLPFLLLYVVLFSTGLALLLAALAVFFRDIVHLWSVFTLAWTYATPLFYPVSMLPNWLQQVMLFNPMYQYITYFRKIVLWGETPGLDTNLICLGMAVVMLAAGILVFRRLQKRFILYI